MDTALKWLDFHLTGTLLVQLMDNNHCESTNATTRIRPPLTRIRPNSRPAAFARLDGRSREAKFLARERARLTEHVGGNPDIAKQVLIEQVAVLGLHIAIQDAHFAEAKTMTIHDSKQYIAWVNTRARLLRQLGAAAPPAAPSLQDYLRERAAQQAADTSAAAA